MMAALGFLAILGWLAAAAAYVMYRAEAADCDLEEQATERWKAECARLQELEVKNARIRALAVDLARKVLEQGGAR